MTPLALDIAIAVIILLSTLIAYVRGIVKEIFTLVGLGLAVFVSYKLGHMLVPGLEKWLGVPVEGSEKKAELILGILSPAMAARVTAYGGAFLITFLVTTLAGFAVTRLIAEVGLGIVDRLLGAGFGFLRGFLLVFLLYVPCTYLIDQKKFPVWAKESQSVPILQSTLVWVNEHFGLDKKIENRGSGVAITFDKVDIDKIGKEENSAEEELKVELEAEEKKPPPVGLKVLEGSGTEPLPDTGGLP